MQEHEETERKNKCGGERGGGGGEERGKVEDKRDWARIKTQPRITPEMKKKKRYSRKT